MRKIELFLSAQDIMGDEKTRDRDIACLCKMIREIDYGEHLWKNKQEIGLLLLCARNNGRLSVVSISGRTSKRKSHSADAHLIQSPITSYVESSNSISCYFSRSCSPHSISHYFLHRRATTLSFACSSADAKDRSCVCVRISGLCTHHNGRSKTHVRTYGPRVPVHTVPFGMMSHWLTSPFLDACGYALSSLACTWRKGKVPHERSKTVLRPNKDRRGAGSGVLRGE
jgi:hypothetical protein